MSLLKKIINSKFIERGKRKLALRTKLYLRLKKLSPSASEDYRTVKILHTFGFTKVIDVGANTGQFAESLIDFGYRGNIISFEPVPQAYEILKKRSLKYKNWEIAERCAVGNFNGKIDINISDNSLFSSIKNIREDYAEYNKHAKSGRTENVKMIKLDSVISEYLNDEDKTFLKIDTQGFEKEVLEGAEMFIKKVHGIKIEIPLMPIYQDVKWGAKDIFNYFYENGFECLSLQPVAVNNKTGIVHEVDGIFIKSTD